MKFVSWSLLLPALPALCALVLVLVLGAPSAVSALLLLVLVSGLTVAAAHYGRRAPRAQLQTVSNLLEVLREGDYAVRLSGARVGDAVLASRFNALAAQLHDEQRAQQQSLQLFSKTLAALDAAVFAFEGEQRLVLLNPAAERLLAQPASELLGRSAEELGLQAVFALPSGEVHALDLAGGSGRWQLGHTALRSRSQHGRLLVLQPVERALRQEEAQAFKRLLRVLGHEINNSLAPIASLADTALQLLPPAGQHWDQEQRQDLYDSLQVIAQRSAALQRFLGGYARLARLPAPQLAPCALAALCRRVQQLLAEPRLQLQLDEELQVQSDADQL